MGRWDNREGFAYGWDSWVPEPDPLIAAWWTQAQTKAVLCSIRDYQWGWLAEVSTYLQPTIDDDTLRRWAGTDPRLRKRSHSRGGRMHWYRRNSLRPLLRHSHWEAHNQGLVDEIRPSKKVECARCSLLFDESSLPTQLVRRLGVDQLDFCSPCLTDTLVSAQAPEFGKSRISKRDSLSWIRELTKVTGRVLPQTLGYRDKDFLIGLSTDERREVLALIMDKPSLTSIRHNFGSWFGLLLASGVLSGDSQHLARGIRTLARDGHVCLSLGERTIDDLLSGAGIPHEREPRYGTSRMRGDFLIGTTIVEYLGLSGDPDYDQKTQRKVAYATEHGIELLLVYPEDLGNLKALEAKLRRCLAHAP